MVKKLNAASSGCVDVHRIIANAVNKPATGAAAADTMPDVLLISIQAASPYRIMQTVFKAGKGSRAYKKQNTRSLIRGAL